MDAFWYCGDARLATLGADHPDWAAAHGRAGAWSVVGVSAVGKSHLRDGLRRDDALLAGGVGPWVAAAVADGAGSAALSRFGATVAVRTVCEALLEGAALWRGEPVTEMDVPAFATALPAACEEGAVWATRSWRRSVSPASPPLSAEAMKRAFTAAHEQVRRSAQALHTGPEKLHCTLLAVLLDTSDGALVVGQVGDGAILCHTPDAGGRWLVEAPSTGQAGESYFLTQPDWEHYFAAASLELPDAGAAVFLMTDGVADDVTYPPNTIEWFTSQMTTQLRQPGSPVDRAAGLLRWLAGYKVQGSFDDRTLLVLMADPLAPSAEPEEGEEEPTPAAAGDAVAGLCGGADEE